MPDVETPVVALCAAAMLMICPVAHAAGPGADDEQPGFSGRVELGAAHRPDYEGSRSSRTPVYLALGMQYRTQDFGTFHAGTRGLGWRWDATGWSAGVAFGRDPGRSDHAPGDEAVRWRPGSPRLRGMGEIPAESVVVLHGHVQTPWLPLHGRLTRTTGDVGGLRLNLGTRIEGSFGSDWTVSLAPSLTWADGRHMQAHFGVSAEQALASGRSRFDAGSGLQSAQAALTSRYRLGGNWALEAEVVAKRLLRDAAASPVTERKEQLSGRVGLSYRF